VASSPYFSVSDTQGKLQLTDLPAGEYQVNIWHPWQITATPSSLVIVSNDDNQLTFSIDVEHQDKPSSPPSGFGSYPQASDVTG
jgi:hypothetical protein